MSETFVDQNTVEMPLPATWGTLNLSQLLEVKTKLLDKIYKARGKQEYLKPLNRALAHLDLLITQKFNDPRGSV
jgi:hypothetical protein